MPPSIPFLRLTPVSQLLILKYISLFQLFDFSLLSKKINSIAKSGKRHIKDFRWTVNIANGTFLLVFKDYENDYFEVCIPPNDRMSIPGEIVFEGRKIRTKREEQSETCQAIGLETESEEERAELFEKLTGHFLAMLNVENYCLSLNKAADLTSFFLWKYTKNFKELSVNWPKTDDVLTAREMEFILGELTVTKKLIIYSKVAEGFQWMEPLNIRRIHLRYGHFLALDVFLNSEVEEWDFDEEDLPITYLNAIMKKWLDGGLEKLKSFGMGSLYDDQEQKLNEALEGIQTFPWDRKTRKKCYTYIDTSEGRDMRRSDGKLATAGVDDDRFYFVVWESDQLRPDSDSSDEDLDDLDEDFDVDFDVDFDEDFDEPI